MASFKLTDGQVAALQPGDRDAYFWDAALPRFGVRVTPAGARIYLVQYRAKSPDGRSVTRRITIGQHDGELWNVTKARAAARKLLAPVDLGRDPFAERLEERAAAHQAQLAAEEARAAETRNRERKSKESFTAVLDAYVERKLAGRRSAGEAERLLRHGPAKAWADRHIAEIRRSDVAELLEQICQRSPSVARSTYAELRPLFEWCAERDLIVVSPCSSLTAPPRPEARDRVLADDELSLIWRAADGMGHPFGTVFKLLMLTGQRRAEVAGTAWDELDMAGAHWRIPAERAKNKQAHEIDLSPQALAILREVPKVGPLLFPARGEGAVRGFSASKRKLDADLEALRAQDAAKAGLDRPVNPLPAWRIHDLRRTAATGMAALGFPPHVVERVLNHVSGVQSGLVGVYQRHEYRTERKAALAAWGAHVASIVSGQPMASNVRKLRA
jgi:integrase